MKRFQSVPGSHGQLRWTDIGNKQLAALGAPVKRAASPGVEGTGMRSNSDIDSGLEPQTELHFRAFRAVDEPATCAVYTAGHQQVLKDYGIENITSNNDTWMGNPNIYCVIAEQDTPEGRVMVGGIRIQQADGKFPLPVENAVGHLDPDVFRIVSSYMDEGVGELCALWNSKAVAKKGISILLVRACISIIAQVGFRTLMGICAEYTLPMFQRVGFVVNNNLGEGGQFAYPNDSYIARVLGILDAQSLNTAHEHDKVRMHSLRTQPHQDCVEVGKYGEVLIHYNLFLPQSN